MKVINVEGAKKPIFSWCPDIEQGAMDQMIELAKLPFVEHCSLMPDAHFGMSMPIGGVLATNGVIIPQAVGVDVGCGLGAFKTNLTLADINGKEEVLHNAVNRSIPMGFSHNTDKRRKEMEEKYTNDIEYFWRKFIVINNSYNNDAVGIKMDSFYSQMGTLGGGNHFLELQVDDTEGFIWVMVHSGSRNIGKKVCDHFNEVAEKLNKMYYSQSTIPFLPVNSVEGKAYLGWMNMALQFAFYNRKVMLEEIERNLLHYFPNMVNTTNSVSPDFTEEQKIINIHHNYAAIEHHYGKDLWVHRKGATLASEKTVGIIPGSQGSASFIVQGKGNRESLSSCSHGAGRKMGRKAFNQAYNTPEKIKEIEDSLVGITHTKFGKAISRNGKDLNMLDLSEAPQAYKNISEVMKNQEDLVRPLLKLMPLINWKDGGEAD
jgi:tRNA-splicing ligase RtcB